MKLNGIKVLGATAVVGLLATVTVLIASGIEFTTTGSMTGPRYGHTATLLADGTVLIAGGFDGSHNLASAQLYDPASGLFMAVGSMTSARATHTATLLLDGTVLVAGGGDATAEIYDPLSHTFAATTGSMSSRWSGRLAALLPDGRVLLDGGEIYDPDTGTFATVPGSVGGGTATLLQDGRVLILAVDLGGDNGRAHIYDPVSGTFTASGETASMRSQYTTTLLTDGTVLVVGGYGGNGLMPGPEIFDPSAGNGNFSATSGNITYPRLGHTATRLLDGTVLVVGGTTNSDGDFLANAEIYDPATGTFSAAAGSMSTARWQHTATLLSNGTVLVTGGRSDVSTALSSAELAGEPHNTPSGVGVVVQSGDVSLTFDSVSVAGDTTVMPIDPASIGEVPGGFAVSGLIAYEVNTSATFSGPVTICFVVPGPISEADFNGLVVLHNENGVLVDVTASAPAREYASLRLCATVNSFSPFYLVRTNLRVVAVFDQTKAYRLNSTVPIKLQLFDASGANVSSPTTVLTARELRRIGGAEAVHAVDSGNANPDSNFRYDSTLGGSGGYVFNLSTKSLSAGRYVLSFYAGSVRSFFYTVALDLK